MSYSFRIDNNRLRFYIDNVSIPANQIPRNIYLELLTKYSKLKQSSYYYQVLPNELKQMLLSVVDLDTLDLLTEKIAEFRNVADDKFWRKMLLSDVCRELNDTGEYSKCHYMYAMNMMLELYRDMTYYSDVGWNWEAFIKCSVFPELLIEQILALYPQFWKYELLKEFINKDTTIIFWENFIALNPDEQNNKCLPYVQHVFSRCLYVAINADNMTLAIYLRDKGIKLQTDYDQVKYLYSHVGYEREKLDLLISCDPNFDAHLRGMLDSLCCYDSDKGDLLLEVINYCLSYGLKSDSLGHHTKNFLNKCNKDANI